MGRLGPMRCKSTEKKSEKHPVAPYFYVCRRKIGKTLSVMQFRVIKPSGCMFTFQHLILE